MRVEVSVAGEAMQSLRFNAAGAGIVRQHCRTDDESMIEYSLGQTRLVNVPETIAAIEIEES